MNASLERALESARRSVFGVLEDEQLRMLLHDSFEFEVIPGQSLYRAGDESRLGLFLEGRIRMYFTAENGRELVVRYAGPDEWIGLPAVVGGPVEIDVEVTEPSGVHHRRRTRTQSVTAPGLQPRSA